MPAFSLAARAATGLPRRLLPALALSCGVALALAACSRVPELEDRLSADLRSQPYPQLLPLGSALAQPALPQEQSAALSESLDARAARLQRRAEALRQRHP